MEPIPPDFSVALSMHSGRGVYALLLGSGVSRASQIPTGWEVVIALIERLAALHEADAQGNPTQWYRDTFGVNPEYTAVLEQVAPTPAERVQLLRSFFEPGPEEDAKRPSAAHHAIARLVASGRVRVIVTTNFDRLLETAIRDAGVEPQVIASPDAIHGALPLVHTPCTVVKVHGDYLDTRIRNTAGEVADFDPAMNRLLDQIFDEFGLLVCGWSGEWDTALRGAIQRAPSRRFSTYWASRRQPEGLAADLCAARAAVHVPIQDADQFFTDLVERLESLERVAATHPLSTAAAIEALKKYLQDPAPRIRAADLILRETGDAIAHFGITVGTHQAVDDRLGKAIIEQWDAALQTLLRLMSVAAYWGSDDLNRELVTAVQRLSYRRGSVSGTWYPHTFELLNYPALLTLYTTGAAAVMSGRYSLLRALLQDAKVQDDQGQRVSAVRELVPGEGADYYLNLVVEPPPSGQKWKWPASMHLESAVVPVLRTLALDDADLTSAFHRLQYLVSLAHWISRDSPWAPVGAFVTRRRQSDAMALIDAEITSQGDQWPPFVAGVFGGLTFADFLNQRGEFESFAQHAADRF